MSQFFTLSKAIGVVAVAVLALGFQFPVQAQASLPKFKSQAELERHINYLPKTKYSPKKSATLKPQNHTVWGSAKLRFNFPESYLPSLAICVNTTLAFTIDSSFGFDYSYDYSNISGTYSINVYDVSGQDLSTLNDSFCSSNSSGLKASSTFTLTDNHRTNISIKGQSNTTVSIIAQTPVQMTEVSPSEIASGTSNQNCSPSPVAPRNYIDCIFALYPGISSNETGYYYYAPEGGIDIALPNYVDFEDTGSCFITDYKSFNDYISCYFRLPLNIPSGTYSPRLAFGEDTSNSLQTSVSITVDASQYQFFKDVPANHTFADFIYGLRDQGIVSGYTDNTFKPDADVSRGAMSKFIKNALFGVGYTNTSCGTFSDVPANHTFYNEIMTLKCRGVVSGFTPTTFKPDEPVTRGQAMKFAVLGARISADNSTLFSKTSTTQDFSDVTSSHPFYQYIMGAYSYCIVSGFTPTSFSPDAKMNRGAMSKVVYNTYNNMFGAFPCK